MADFPSLPLWTDAYLADTIDLSAEEHGVYLLLLMAAWRTPTCSLPDDDARLARMAKVGPKKWKRMRPVMERFFTVSDGQWTQNRLLKERDRVETSRNQKRQAAHAKHRKTPNNKSASADAESVRKFCNPEPEPYPETKETKEGAGAPPDDDWNDDANLYRRGVSILGAKQRGAITQLRKQCGDVFEARQIIEQAQDKEHPVSWVYGIIQHKRKEARKPFKGYTPNEGAGAKITPLGVGG